MPEAATALNGALPIIPYPDPRAAIAWLERAFGGVATEVHQPDPDQPYGPREFAARDHHGNVWSFGTYRPSGA